MPYADYLQTVDWRKTRDRKLRAAGWKCERCPASQALQVHHKTYARLGAELDEDLEVLCSTCHNGHHFDEGTREYVDVYVRLVSEVLKDATVDTITDLSAEVKQACAKHRIPYDGERVHRAVSFLETRRQRFLVAPRRTVIIDVKGEPPAITKQDAREICRRLADKGLLVRAMPTAPWSDPDVFARQLELAHLADVDIP